MFKPRPLFLACSLLMATLAQADTLQDVYELAVKNDPVLKAAEAQYRASREAMPLSRAALLPNISGQAQYTHSDMDQSARTPVTATTGTAYNRGVDTEQGAYSVTLSQAIFDLPAWFTFQQGKQISQQAEAQLASSQQDLIIRAANAYFNVLRAQENLASSKAQERAFQRQLEQTKQRFDVGLIAITDVHEAQAAADNAVVTRLSDEGALGIAYEGLTVLTGQSHQNIWTLREDFAATPPVPENRDEWVQFSLKNNYDLKASRYAAQAASENASAKKAGHLPTLRGGYTYNETRADGDMNDHWTGASSPFDNKSQGGTAFLTLQVPIFSGGAISATRRQAFEQSNAAEETFISTERNTIQQTRSLHLSVLTDAQRVKARKQAIVSAQSALDATSAGYEVGTRNIVDVLQAQQVLFQALRDYANARYDYIVHELQLKRLAGTLSPQDIIDLSKWLEAPKAPTLSEDKS